MKAYTDRYITKSALTQEEWDSNLRCDTDVVALRRALPFYNPVEGAVEASRVAMVDATGMFPGSWASPWWDPSTPAKSRDAKGDMPPLDHTFK